MDEGNIKTPIPKCRLYRCFCLGWWSNFVGSEPGQKQSVKLLRESRGATVNKRGRKYQRDCLYLQSINSIQHQ
jgi:hypothetical protein